MRDAQKWQLVSQNPVRLVDRLKKSRAETTIWNVDQTQSFVETALKSHLRYGPALVLKLALGLRTAELFGLRWADLDLEGSRATICQTYTWSYGKPTLGDPKSYAGLRTLGLNSVALRALGLLQAIRSNGYVVATETGQVPNPSNLRENLE
jgi:integrase